MINAAHRLLHFACFALIPLIVISYAKSADCAETHFESIALRLYGHYPIRGFINVARIRESYVGQVYLKNAIQNLAKTEPAWKTVEDVLFQNLDSVLLLSESYAASFGQATQELPPMILVCRGRVDISKWRQFVPDNQTGIEIGELTFYQTHIGGDIEQNTNPVIPYIQRDQNIYLGLSSSNIAVVSYGVSEAILRERFSSLANDADPRDEASFKKSASMAQTRMVYVEGKMPALGEAGDGALAFETPVTLTCDVVNQIEVEFRFEGATVRDAGKLEVILRKRLDEFMAPAPVFLAAAGDRGVLLREFVEGLSISRMAQSVFAKLNVPLALLHMWAADNGSKPIYWDANAVEVPTRDLAKFLWLDTYTLGGVADEVTVAVDAIGGKSYARHRFECFGIDGTRQSIPGSATGVAIRIETHLLSDDAIDMLLPAVIEYFDSEKNPVCCEGGYAKLTRIYDPGSHIPVDARFADTDGNPCKVSVAIKTVLPESQALKVGLVVGDVIHSVNGELITSLDRLKYLLKLGPDAQAGADADAIVKLIVLRDGKTKTFEVKHDLLGVEPIEFATLGDK